MHILHEIEHTDLDICMCIYIYRYICRSVNVLFSPKQLFDHRDPLFPFPKISGKGFCSHIWEQWAHLISLGNWRGDDLQV